MNNKRMKSVIPILFLLSSLFAFQPANKSELQAAVDLWVSDNATALSTYGEINSWDVSLITDMSHLFKDKYTFNDDIGNWDVSNVIIMSRMFTSAADFVQDISGWCVSRINNEPSNFINSAGTNSWRADTSKHPEWGVCNSNVSVTLTDTDADNLLAASDLSEAAKKVVQVTK